MGEALAAFGSPSATADADPAVWEALSRADMRIRSKNHAFISSFSRAKLDVARLDARQLHALVARLCAGHGAVGMRGTMEARSVLKRADKKARAACRASAREGRMGGKAGSVVAYLCS